MLAERLYHQMPIWLQGALLDGYALGIEWHRYGKACEGQLERLLQSERLPRDELDAQRDEQVRRIVEFAYAASPYYRAVMDDRRLRPGDFRTAADLVKLPVLSRDAVQHRAADLLTAKRPKVGWRTGHTSGTTGSPLGVSYDRQACVLNNAVDRRQKHWGGWRPGQWIGMLLGRVIVPVRQTKPPFWRFNHVQRQVWFSSFHVSNETLPVYVAEMRRRGLEYLEGYPSTLYVLARFLIRNGATLPMKAVFSSSETLLPIQREAIERAFDCRLFDFYGLAERVTFAGECEVHDGLHLAEEYTYTEVVDERGDPVAPGKRGFLVGTNLHNKAMPLIRYQVRDLTSLTTSPCACGRTLHRMDSVATKAEDFVVTPDGRVVSPSVLTHPFKPLHGLRESQLVQEDKALLRVLVVVDGQFADDERRSLVLALQERLGPAMTIRVEQVAQIPRTPSGKFRWVVSHVASDYKLSWERTE